MGYPTDSGRDHGDGDGNQEHRDHNIARDTVLTTDIVHGLALRWNRAMGEVQPLQRPRFIGALSA